MKKIKTKQFLPKPDFNFPKVRKLNLKKQELKKKRNFFLTFVVMTLLWSVTLLIVFFVDPETFGILPIFFLTIFLALLFTASSLFANTRRGLILASAITVFIILRYFGVGNLINLLLIMGIGITTEIYSSRI